MYVHFGGFALIVYVVLNEYSARLGTSILEPAHYPNTDRQGGVAAPLGFCGDLPSAHHSHINYSGYILCMHYGSFVQAPRQATPDQRTITKSRLPVPHTYSIPTAYIGVRSDTLPGEINRKWSLSLRTPYSVHSTARTNTPSTAFASIFARTGRDLEILREANVR